VAGAKYIQTNDSDDLQGRAFLTMIVECPHCGANYPVDEQQFAGGRLKGQCKECNSSFAIDAPPDLQEVVPTQTVALAVIEGPARGQVFRLTKARTILGRSGADIVLYDPEVSRKHCVIEVRGSSATLTDLGTANGTFVAGKTIQNCELKHLASFRIGATTMVFTVTNKPLSDAEPPPTLVVNRGGS
jgi:predicted Zn finger-like uncharacterized protein